VPPNLDHQHVEPALSARETFGAAAGSFVLLPPGRAHQLWADVVPARLLLMAAPGGIGDHLREIDAATS
jgi:hypothetical protein